MLLAKENCIYRCGDLALAPYPTEKVLAEGYLRFEQEGTLDSIFHQGPSTLTNFLTQFVKEQQAILTFLKGNQHIGFAWFNYLSTIGNSKAKKAEAGMAFFRKTHPRDALLACAMGTDWVFEELNVDVMFGVTPEKNKAAVKFFKRLGRDFYGPIPLFTCFPDGNGGYEPCGAYVSAMTRGKWSGVRSNWFDNSIT